MRGGEGNETTSRLTMVEEDVPAFPTPLTVKVWCSLISQLYPSYIISQPNTLFSPLYLPSQGKQPLLMGKDISLAPSGIGGTPWSLVFVMGECWCVSVFVVCSLPVILSEPPGASCFLDYSGKIPPGLPVWEHLDDWITAKHVTTHGNAVFTLSTIYRCQWTSKLCLGENMGEVERWIR